MNIREAVIEDAHEWSRMRTRLWPDTPDQHYSEINAYFAGLAHNPEQVYVVEDEGLVGFIELYVRNYAEGSISSHIPFIEGWYVESKFQNKGLGARLIQKAEQWARDQGYAELASDTEVDNSRSIAVHKHLGFAETGRTVNFLKQLK